MNIAFCCTDTKAEPWLQGLQAALPGAAVSVWQPGAPAADYAVVWAPPQQFLDEQTGLKALFNIGAGVDALLQLKLPPHALVVRLDDAGMAVQMADTCAMPSSAISANSMPAKLPCAQANGPFASRACARIFRWV